MTEKTDQWPRVHTCLYDWCPKKSDECDRCDRVLAIMRRTAPTFGEPVAVTAGK